MDKRNICHRGKKKSTKKTKKYATVDYFQSHFYNLREGRKIPFDSSGKAVVEFSPVSKITFFQQDEPTKKKDTSRIVFRKKEKGVPRRRRSRVVAPSRQHEAEFREVFGSTSDCSFWFNE